MKTTLTILILTFSTMATGQVMFQRTLGGTQYEAGWSVKQTTDNGYIMTGYVDSYGAGQYDVYLIKTDEFGDTLWTKVFGGFNPDEGRSVEQTTDGGYIIGGYTWSFGAGSEDFYLIKTDASGNITWSKTIGGLGVDVGNSVQQTTDGGYIITGTTSSYGAGIRAIYLVKTDGSGNLSWTKTYGGVNAEVGSSVQQTTDGGYIILGYGNTFGAGQDDFYLIKTDSNGDTLWSKTYGGGGNEWAHCVRQTTDGGYIMAGVTWSFGAGNADVYLVKADASGNLEWSKVYGGFSAEWALAVEQTTDGGYALIGYTISFGLALPDVYFIKTDAVGDTLWTRLYGGAGSDYGYSIKQTADGGYVIVGLDGSFGAGLSDIYFIKTDANGNSPCNQSSPPTMTSTPATQVSTPLTLVSSGWSESTPTTSVTGGAITDSLCLTIGIATSTITQQIINIYPNPSSQHTTLEFENSQQENHTLTLYDTQGRLVRTIANITTGKLTIDTHNLTRGLYFFQLRNDRQVRFTGKLTIE